MLQLSFSVVHDRLIRRYYFQSEAFCQPHVWTFLNVVQSTSLDAFLACRALPHGKFCLRSRLHFRNDERARHALDHFVKLASSASLAVSSGSDLLN